MRKERFLEYIWKKEKYDDKGVWLQISIIVFAIPKKYGDLYLLTRYLN